MSGHLLGRVVGWAQLRHEEILKPKGPILRLWAPKVAFTKACSGFRLPGHKRGQKVEIPRTPRVNPKTLSAEGGFYKGLFTWLRILHASLSIRLNPKTLGG